MKSFLYNKLFFLVRHEISKPLRKGDVIYKTEFFFKLLGVCVRVSKG